MSPWAFESHVAAWLAIAIAAAVYLVLVRRDRPTRRQWWQFACLIASLAVALTWPVADLAAHWTLTGLLVQRLVLTMVSAPLILLCVPEPVWSRLTRPPKVDAVVDAVTRPAVAIVVFTVVVVGTLVVPAVRVQANDWWARGSFDLVLVGAGLVLWLPVLGRVPGARRMSGMGRAVYLVVQSVLPNFPSVIFIFARHPLYGVFAGSHLAIGLQPVNDQQLAGVLAKVATIPVLWSVAYVSLMRAQRADETGVDEEPLTWLEVERELERAERRAPHAGEEAARG